MYSTV